MDFPPLISGRLLRRHRRFLADVALPDGSHVTAHCPNTGSLAGLDRPGERVWLSRSQNPRRRYPLTWELVEAESGALVCVNTTRTNRLAAEAIRQGIVRPLAGYAEIRPEVPFGEEGSRVDLLLEDHAAGRCWVEVKSVTLVRGGVAQFPDAVTTRGQRHLRELVRVAARGDGAVLLFCIQRADASAFAPAADIDPAYADLMVEAAASGVEILAWRSVVTLEKIALTSAVPVRLN